MAIVKDIDVENTRHLDASVGWIGLGNLTEAEAEIGQVIPEFRLHADVLEVRWEIDGRQERWESALETAVLLVETWPERCSGWLHRSYCLHELGRTLEAWNKLISAVDRFPKEATVPYNLACYACQLGNLEQAQSWLEKAASIRGRRAIKSMAVEDQDLVALHTTLSSW
ncbi:tetratricopeptide repeat protein [Verrucomicrobia bacterium]|jgi:tetratricopeptide (TPR) repeat protein|nr:tetratricopeptide repeat protein [Verrucomicrobiota bacterium]MDA7680378.1 tetratricopeptide repeat protein [bacterium]MDA7866502.1 tetratricopeptide repeat protein [Verrucomicrobiota bacterium]MDB4798010.1 tetratricopeptide repeat protein [Verrucomicrobiota bacterium]